MPAMIAYLKGDATNPQGQGNKVVAHICNDVGGWGKGFVMALSARWKAPEQDYREWYRKRAENDFTLGAVQYVQVAADIWIANMVGQRGMYSRRDGPPIRYDAVETCLKAVADKATEIRASVHMPRIGCGLAGGTWDCIEPIILRTLCAANISVTVYDFA